MFDMNEISKAALAFQAIMGQDPMNADLHMHNISEELEETNEALMIFMGRPDVRNGSHLIKEMADLFYVVGGASELSPVQVTDEFDEVLNEVGETLMRLEEEIAPYIGDFALLEAVRRVHLSNLSKMGEDGKPIYREDGKVLKGPNYEPPYLDDLAVLLLHNYERDN